MECLRAMDSLLSHPALAARQSDGHLCNAAFGAVSNHPWVEAQLTLAPWYRGSAG